MSGGYNALGLTVHQNYSHTPWVGGTGVGGCLGLAGEGLEQYDSSWGRMAVG